MKTLYQKNRDNEQAFGNRTYTTPAKYYAGLSITPVLDDDDYIVESKFTEATALDYARIEINNNSTTFSTSVDGIVTNAVEFEFTEATSDWGKVYAVGLYDSLTGGNLLYISTLNKSKTVEDETSLRIKVGALEFIEADVPVTVS